ncbi:uncharacterized protein LOC129771245 [Toxorhynchites rutilus septentrionalis]|uniref:uncharacterized protein LOC129771245 n=1 Tax=Toxorhynchites rutilus septentrionalis TaxID=329112 RepID=UPI002478C7E5|nr:uncharacterized protein LOC129771245 [Toxorhynchites rutilus septentrionalis]
MRESKGKKFSVDHFRDENVPVSTVYRILASRNVERKTGRGCPAKIMTKKKKESLKKLTLKQERIVCWKNGPPEYTDELIATEISVPVDDEKLSRDVVRAGRREFFSAVKVPYSRQ